MLLAVFLFATLGSNAQMSSDLDNLKLEELSETNLLTWPVYGIGVVESEPNGQLFMAESENSKGMMLVSPTPYKDSVVFVYDVMTLRPATVLVVELASYNNDAFGIDFPSEYDGNLKYLMDNVNMYMFAFHNAPHNKFPFVRKYPEPGTEPLVAATETVMHPGIYYHVEVGQLGAKLYLKVDGKTIFETQDKDPFKGGKVIIRIRGTAREVASCLIKNVKIYSNTH